MTRSRWIILAAVVVLLAIWEGICRAGWVSPILLAPPSRIGAAAISEGPQFLVGLRVTVTEIVVAAVVASALGICVGLMAGFIRPVGHAIGPLLSAFFAVPHIVWYPLFLVWFGIGTSSKVAYGIFGGFFPVALTTMEAVRHLDRQYVTLGRSFGAGQVRLMRSILVPLAFPGVMSGLRLGVSLVVISIIVAEMLSSLGGVGYLISYYRTTFATGPVYLGIALALACAGSANVILSRIERRFGRWRELEKSRD